MAEKRMSLEEAAKLLGGLHPNTVRSRARNGKIPFEKDNSGKWWVFIDPEVAANDAKTQPTKSATKQLTMEPELSSAFKALEAIIENLREELAGTRAERDALRESASESVRLAAEVAGLEARIADLRADRDETVADLRADRDGWRKQAENLALMLPAPANAPPSEVEAAPPEVPATGQGRAVGGFWSWLRGKPPSND